MKMREWVRVTYLALKDRPAAERVHHFTQTQVEDVMQMSIQTLLEALAAGEELRLNNLGRLWVEELPPRRIVSNLPNKAQQYHINARKKVRFQASNKLKRFLSSLYDYDV